jgi:phosphatidylserine decarboxylase precursor
MTEKQHNTKIMYKLTRFSHFLTILLLIAFCTVCTNKKSVEEKEYGTATKALIEILENNPDVKSMLETSLEKARQINPDKKTNPVQNVDEYYDFVTYCETAMPWAVVKKPEYADIFSNMFQSLLYFHYLLDQPLPELEGKGLYKNTLQYTEPLASWLITFSKSWGSYLDTKDSWNDEYYQMAFKDPAIGLQNGWYEDGSNWKTFNQFFARYLASPEQRPIASPDDNSVVVSYADSKPMGIWAIDSNSNLVTEEGLPVKSATLKSIVNLIGENSAYKDAFANGTFTHSFLNVNDYHRYHFPLAGTVKEARIIQGTNPTGGSITWDKENNRYAFDPSDVGWQTVETRGCVILDCGEYGLVALLPIGMAAVGSVNFEENVKPGVEVEKGDMLGYFAFGGSDFIMIFQDKVEFTLDVAKEEGGDSYKHLLVGERLGQMKIK